MAGRGKTVTVEEPEEAQTGRKMRMNLRIGGPGILVGALAVAVVVGAAIRIRRYRSLHKARKRFQCSMDYPCDSVDGTSEMIFSWKSEEEALEDGSKLEEEIQIVKNGEIEGDKASDTDHGEWMAKGISESSEEEESTNEAEGEEIYGSAEDEVGANEAEEEEDAGNEAEEENDDTDDEYEDGDDGECILEKCEEGSQGTEESSMESNAQVVWPEETKEWPLEIKEMKISYHEYGIARIQSYDFLNKTESRIPVKIKLRIWIWTSLMLLLLLLLSVANQKSYVSLSY